jgi:hypothetical protein
VHNEYSTTPNGVGQIKSSASITEVWFALGGDKLRRNRGRAFWRCGDGFSISIDPQKQLWYDFVTGTGGDVISLVRTARQCSFLEAAEWLAAHTGIPVSKWIRDERDSDSNFADDLQQAAYWQIAARALAEHVLEELPYCPEREGLTALLAAIELGPASLVREFRAWRRRQPELTEAMTRAGQRADARLQRLLALWIVEAANA